MKQFSDMSKKELAALTPDEIDTLMDYECALAGVPLLPVLPVKPDVPTFEPDVEVYCVAGFKFTDKSQAEKVLADLISSDLVEYSYGNRVIKPLDSYSQPSIKTEKYFSAKYYEEISAEKKLSQAKLDQYQEAMDTYDAILKQRNGVTEEFYTMIRDAVSEEYEKERYRTIFKRYVSLASGDKETAFNFLFNAYPHISEIEDFEGFKAELVETNA